MASTVDQDPVFSGNINGSTPATLLGAGTVARILNGRFIEGAITNAVGFDELDFHYAYGPEIRIFASPITYDRLLKLGDVQLTAPLQNINGNFLVTVISGVLLLHDLSTFKVYDITPLDSFLPPTSNSGLPLAFLDNDGGVQAVGGYLVIFNYPNKCIFVNQDGARLSNPFDFEMPPARLGCTASSRAFVASGLNIVYASDPLGGASSLAPLTFAETLDTAGSFYGQVFSPGSALDAAKITAICRLPKFLGPTQEFRAQSVLVSTEETKHILAAGNPRAIWDTIQFITDAGSTDGMAGPHTWTLINNTIVYTAKSGRIKLISQDQERDTGLVETFFDYPLGQYLSRDESSFYYRYWYKSLDHSRVMMKYRQNRLYASAYPIQVPAITKYGYPISSPSHRALAVASLDDETRLGPQASLAWEGYYDWLQPIGVCVINKLVYIVSKDYFGRIRYYRENPEKLDNHTTLIYTRGYVPAGGNQQLSRSRSVVSATLFFRQLAGPIGIKIYALINDEWCLVSPKECKVTQKYFEVTFRDKKISNSSSIPLRIELDHNGCQFELENITVSGESFADSVG